MRRRRIERETESHWIIPETKFRLLLLGVLFLAGFLLIGIKLYQEQIRSGENHREKISRQSIRRIRIPARRGNIYTREGKLLAGNQGECSLIFYPEEMRISSRRSRTIDYIYSAALAVSQAIERPNPLTREEIARHLNTRPGLPIVVFKQLTPREQALVLERARAFRGIELVESESRIYPQKRLASHLIGYVQPESPQKAEDRNDFFYYVPDLTGKSGLERAFDRFPETDAPVTPSGLRGLPGYSLVQVDHLGFIRQALIQKIEPRHGNHLITTLDHRAQQLAESVLQARRAALVLLDANNGDILASASNPGFDLSYFTPVIDRDYYSALVRNSDKPLFNRAFNGTYTPGSILKPLVALAFLNEGIDPREPIICDGFTQIAEAKIRCASWRSGGHGSLNLTGALAHSCNDYMIENSLKVGLNPIAAELQSAGIGRPTGVELSEGSGTFPSSELKKRRYGYSWNNYDTALLSMGQGLITITPLQAAVYTAAIANGGKIYRPHLGWKMVDVYGNILFERKEQITGLLATTPDALAEVRKGMHDVVNTPDGSGREAAVPGLTIYGKTGSAEVGSVENRFLITWFICFVEFNGKTYAAALMVEEGRSGGKSCAPLAAEFFRRYLLSPTENP